MESKLKTLCNALLDCMVLPMQDKLEDWRKSATLLDKDHAKEYKKLRSDIKKKTEAVQRAQKKQKKSKGGNEVSSKALDSSMLELTKNLKILQDTEKSAVRKVLTEERSRYCTFVASLRPVLEEEAAMVSDFQQLEEINKKLVKVTDDPFKLPPASEQVINDMKSDGSGGFTFQTPPSSPSSLGSRKSSMCSISSAGSSNGSPSHHAANSHNAAMNAMHLRNKQGGGVPGGVRLSSVSSQDSGFTSQDTLFLRPGSPRRNGGGQQPPQPPSIGPPPGPEDRPHTISTAYEKGGLHQRPQLQPYTFSPPESTLTIDEHPQEMKLNSMNNGMNGSNSSLAQKPPVPQRCGPLQTERPSIPGKTLAATMAAAKQQQLQMQISSKQPASMGGPGGAGAGTNGGGGGLPNFHANRNDMGV